MSRTDRLKPHEKSKYCQEKAIKQIPEGTSSNVRGKNSYMPYPMVFMERGDGAYLFDIDGNEYIDCLCGVSSIILGHCNDEQMNAVHDQINKGTYFATAHESEYQTAEMLNELIPSSDQVKFTNTGTEAAMNAIRIARSFTGKDKVLKFEGMYHGHTDQLLFNVHPEVNSLGTRQSAEKIPSTSGIPNAGRSSVITIPWNDIDLLEEKLERHGDEIAAVITEAFLSNSGLIFPTANFNNKLRQLTKKHNVLLILDEVITGFRVGLTGAQTYFDIEPDISIWGKAIANGYPSAAITGREKVMKCIGAEPEGVDFMGTFSGNPLAVTAIKSNLEILNDIGKEGYIEFHSKGQRLVDGLNQILIDAGHNVNIPDFIGFSHIYFHDGETDPDNWSDYRDVKRHAVEAKWSRFAFEMIQQNVYMVPRPYGRLNLTHAHKDEDIDKILESAKIAAKNVPHSIKNGNMSNSWG